jgi:hypothetical protein
MDVTTPSATSLNMSPPLNFRAFRLSSLRRPVAPVRDILYRILPKHDSFNQVGLRAAIVLTGTTRSRKSGIPDLRVIDREPASDGWRTVAAMAPDDQIDELHGTGISR